MSEKINIGFPSQLSNGIGMVTVNYFDGLLSDSKSRTSRPPSDMNTEVNAEDYRKAFQANPVLMWGTDNRYPEELDTEARMSSVFEGGMKVLCDHLRGQAFTLAVPVYKDGKRILEEVEDEEVMDELYDIGYYEYWQDACGELPKWGNVWPIFKMNEKKDIRLIHTFDGTWCRFQRPHPKTAKIENLYVSAQWGRQIHNRFTKGAIPKDLKAWVFQYPLLSRYHYVNELELLSKTKQTFAAHIKYHTSGSFYGRAPWHSLFENRWLAISGKVPEMIVRYYEAAMTINYLFYINQDWLQEKFPDMSEWTEEQRKKKIKELQDAYEKNLKGTGNAFKSLMLTFKMDPNGKEVKNLMIEVLDNKMREGQFLPDSQMSDGQVLFTLGVDPSLIGVVVPGGKQSAGSGSNIREASLALQMRQRPDREMIHNAFYIWRDYKFRNTSDKRKKKLVIVTKDYMINTLDQRAPAAAQETTPSN